MADNKSRETSGVERAAKSTAGPRARALRAAPRRKALGKSYGAPRSRGSPPPTSFASTLWPALIVGPSASAAATSTAWALYSTNLLAELGDLPLQLLHLGNLVAAIIAASVAARVSATFAGRPRGDLALALGVVVIAHQQHVRPIHGEQRPHDRDRSEALGSFSAVLLPDRHSGAGQPLYLGDILSPPPNQRAALRVRQHARDAVVELDVVRRHRPCKIA
mmetsp:Transcript_85173/g.237743  ORF Transcript_85173/g.237743 Transcript_85173/m.237743 type:complete len:220 (-) Transcript_85173:1280-1939(-)